MTTPYRKVSNRFWISITVRKRLSEDARWLFLYLITCPHNNALGLFVLPEMYALADLGWEPKRYRKAMVELTQVERFGDGCQGVIGQDQNTDLILIKDHMAVEGCDNPNQVKAQMSFLESLPNNSPLYEDLAHTCELLGKPFLQPLIEGLRQRSGVGLPNHEHEHEHEHEHDIPRQTPSAQPDEPSEFDQLMARYGGEQQATIHRCLTALATTRRSGVIADSIILAELRKWDTKPVSTIMAGISIYLDEKHYEMGKKENYLWGIIRNDPESRINQNRKADPNGRPHPPQEVVDRYANVPVTE